MVKSYGERFVVLITLAGSFKWAVIWGWIYFSLLVCHDFSVPACIRTACRGSCVLFYHLLIVTKVVELHAMQSTSRVLFFLLLLLIFLLLLLIAIFMTYEQRTSVPHQLLLHVVECICLQLRYLVIFSFEYFYAKHIKGVMRICYMYKPLICPTWILLN